MKIRVTLCLALALLLSLCLSAASANTELSAQEISKMKSFLGTSDTDPVLSLSQNNLTAFHVLDWLEDYGDQAGAYSGAFEDISLMDAYWTAAMGSTDSAVAQAMRALEDADTNFDNEVIRPLQYYHDRMDYAANRLEYILYTLSSDSTLTGGNREAIAKEARTLLAQMEEDIAAVVTLKNSAEASVSAAKNALDTADGTLVDAHLGRALGLMHDEAQRRQDIENASLQTNDAGTSIVVISDQEFSVSVLASTTKGDCVAGAVVTVENKDNKKSITTGANGVATFEINDFSPDKNKHIKVHITVETPGRRAIELEEEEIAGAQTINLVQSKDDGTPYLRMASFNKKDLNLYENAIYYTDKNFADLPLSVKIENVTGACILSVLLGERECARKTLTGTETGFPLVTWTDKWCRILKTAELDGEQLSIQLVKDGVKYTFGTAMTVKKAVVDEPLYQNNPFNPFSPGAITLKLPQLAIPGADSASLSLGIPEMPVAFTVGTDGSVLFYAGAAKWDPYDWKTTDSREREAFQKDYAKDSKNKIWDMAKGVASRDYITDKKPFLGSVKVNISIFAGGVGKYDAEKSVVSISGSIGVSITLAINLSKQFYIPTPVVPIPAFIGFDFSLGLTAASTLNVSFTTDKAKWDNFHIELTDEKSVNLRLEVGMTLGIGFADIASISVRGYAFFSTTLWFEASSVSGVRITYQLEYGGGADLTIKFLILKLNVPLFKFSDTYPKEPGKLFPTEPPAALAGSNDGAVTYQQETGATALRASQMLGGTPLLTAADNSDKDGVRPEQEILHDGKFLYTSLKSIGIKAGDAAYQLTFFLGSYENGAGVATQKLFYAVPMDTTLNVQGLIDTETDGETAYDFDLAWDSENQKLYTIVAYRRAESFSTDVSRVRIARYSFAINQTTGLPEASQDMTTNFAPLNEKGFAPGTGTLRYTTIGKPRISLFSYIDTDIKGQQQIKTGVFFALCAKDTGAPNETNVYGGVYYSDGRRFDGDLDTGSIYHLMTVPAGDTPIDLQLSTGTDDAHPFFLLTGTAEGEGENIQYKQMKLALNSASIVHGQTLADPDTVTVSTLDTVENRCIVSMMNAFVTSSDIGCVFIEEVSDADGNPVRTVNGYTYKDAGKAEIVDYGINAAVDWFGATSLNGAKYLYWVQSHEATDENAVVDKRYQVFCCLYDPAANAFSAPFTLLQLKKAPTVLALSNWDPAGGKNAFGLYMCEDDTDPSDDPPSRFVSIEFKLKAAMALNAAVSEYPCVAAGSDANFYLTVENTGNMPIAAFDARITDTATQYNVVIHVDAAQPEKSSLMVMSTTNSAMLFSADQFSVYRVPGIYDEFNGESMTQTITSPASPDTFREVSVRAIMPDAIRVYKVVMKIPATWKGDKSLTAALENLKVPTANGNAATVNAGGTALTATPLFIVQESGTDAADILTNAEQDRAVQALLARNDTPFVQALDTLRTAPAKIDLAQSDLTLEQDVLTLDGEKYLQINLKNTSYLETLGAGDRGGPMLTITRDGRTSFTHQFALPLDNRFGYTLLLPLDQVDGDGQYLELTTAVQGAGADFNEFDDFDNAETLTFKAPTPTPSPAPSPTPGPTPPATGDARPAQKYAALLAISLLIIAAACVLLRRRRE